MSEFWVYNTTDMDFNVKFDGGKYRVEKGKTVNLVLATQGKLTVEQLEEDPLVQKYLGRGLWIRTNGPKAVIEEENESPVVAEVVPSATGRTDRSVVMKSTMDPDVEEAAAAASQEALQGTPEVVGKVTVINSPEDSEDNSEVSPVNGMVEAGTPNLPGALAINPPSDVEFAAGLTPEANIRLSDNLKKAKAAQETRIKQATALENRLDPSRCQAITNSGSQCRKDKANGDYCNIPKHAKLAE